MTLLAKLKTLFYNTKCSHEFYGYDLKPRDESGLVSWKCSKCGKVFKAEYGLKILDNGKCMGGWGVKCKP
jgi:hypothetical protein